MDQIKANTLLSVDEQIMIESAYVAATSIRDKLAEVMSALNIEDPTSLPNTEVNTSLLLEIVISYSRVFQLVSRKYTNLAMYSDSPEQLH